MTHALRRGGQKPLRLLLQIVVALLTVTPLIPAAQVAQAQATCILTSVPPTCPDNSPPPLLNLDQPLYAATDNQRKSLENLEDQAVTNIVNGHSLAPSDANAVKSWARADAQAELYALLVAAINTSAASRTLDQQNAVDWLDAIVQRQNAAAAQASGREYVKWAGLDQSQYDALLNRTHTESDLKTFLSGHVSSVGYCGYRSPAPYETDYTGYNDPSCSTTACQFSLICNPPTPSYDQFVKWGEGAANYTLLSSEDYRSTSQKIALGLAFGIPLGVIYTTGLLGAYVGVLATSYVAAAAGAGWEETVVSFIATKFASGTFLLTAAIVVTSLATAIVEGVKIADADQLPGKLATFIHTKETTAGDLSSSTTSSDAATLYSLFVGATLPSPFDATCDNSNPSSEPGLTVLAGIVTVVGKPPCLNPTAIPPASSSDPQFLIQAMGATTQTSSPTLTWQDVASGTTTEARLNSTWFITRVNGSTTETQALSIDYTDWNAKEQRAWLVANANSGYTFLSFSPPANGTSVDPSTCVSTGVCSYGSSINVIGSDGQHYSASVKAYSTPVGTPSYSSAIEGSPVTFSANTFVPASSSGPYAYEWRFQKAGCGFQACIDTTGAPLYTDPVGGETAMYTWQSSGDYRVEVTVTDPASPPHVAVATLTVSVLDVPPTLTLSAACPAPAPCDTRTSNSGATTVTGNIAHAGTLDTEIVRVQWGDESSLEASEVGPNAFVFPGPLKLAAVDQHNFSLSDTHTYAKPGVYYGSVVTTDVTDITYSKTVSKTFTETIQGSQAIVFPPIVAHHVGDVFTVSATGGASGNPVTFASSDPTACALSGAQAGVDASGNGTGSAVVTALKEPGCTLTASQAGTVDAAGTTVWTPATSVSEPVFVQPNTLTVTASSASITYGEATVPPITPSYSGFVNGDTLSALTSPATCSVAQNTGAAGTYATDCSGAVDPNYDFTYVPGTLTINKAPLTSTANDKSMVYGSSLPVFDAILSGLVNGDPSSVVSNLVCAALDASGKPVSLTTPVGQYSINCSGGTAANYALTYRSGNLTITQANTSVALSSTPAGAVYGQPVTLTASLAASAPGSGDPSGTVDFQDGGVDISGCDKQPVNTTAHTAVCTTSTLGAGSHSIAASYSGDHNFVGSTTASPVTQTIARAASSVTLAPTSPSTQGQNVTFTAVVAPTPPGGGTPTGTVAFSDGGTSLGTAQLSVAGGNVQATFSTSHLATGAHTITASYGGDANFLTSAASAAVTQYVNINLSGYPKLPSGAYNLSNVNLSGAYLVGVSLVGADLTGANLTGAVFTGADLTGANLSDSNLKGGANFTNVNLKNANLNNSNLKGSNFTGSNLSGAELTNTNLSGATGLKTATLTGVVWQGTTCPDGTSSDKNGGTCVGHF
jgi:uncharacterized protein YjbI with pentapeptide repeats